jgi:hypothetical protein
VALSNDGNSSHCASLVGPRSSFAAAATDQVTVGYSSFSGAYVPLWIAVEEQLGRKYGLELKAIYVGRVRSNCSPVARFHLSSPLAPVL